MVLYHNLVQNIGESRDYCREVVSIRFNEIMSGNGQWIDVMFTKRSDERCAHNRKINWPPSVRCPVNESRHEISADHSRNLSKEKVQLSENQVLDSLVAKTTDGTSDNFKLISNNGVVSEMSTMHITRQIVSWTRFPVNSNNWDRYSLGHIQVWGGSIKFENGTLIQNCDR